MDKKKKTLIHFSKYFLLFRRIKKVLQVYKNMRARNLWNFCVNYPLNLPKSM